MNIRFTALPAALALCLSLTAQAEGRVIKNYNYAIDDDKPWQEEDYALPPYPQAADWVEVKPDWLQQNRYFVDAGSLSIGKDGVVRYISKVLSSGGVENLSAEGILCKDNKYRAYGFGDSVNHRWIEPMRPLWQDIVFGDKLRRELRERLCPDHQAPRDLDVARQALRKGG
ncbi:CNP1-like family protein [Chromobacterium sp. CV08]|uniref:CNP1-like family protein n=1 Tax=Chromobacterium sp. CV08 TaxID=3133274 RepID=UPI003DA899DC